MTSLLPKAEVERLAHESGVVRRRREVDASAMLWSVLLGFGTGRERTLAGLRRTYERVTWKSLVPSSFYDRFSTELARMFRAVLQELMTKLAGNDVRYGGVLKDFRDVLVADATVVKLHALLARRFPDTRKNSSPAAAKLHPAMAAHAAEQPAAEWDNEGLAPEDVPAGTSRQDTSPADAATDVGARAPVTAHQREDAQVFLTDVPRGTFIRGPSRTVRRADALAWMAERLFELGDAPALAPDRHEIVVHVEGGFDVQRLDDGAFRFTNPHGLGIKPPHPQETSSPDTIIIQNDSLGSHRLRDRDRALARGAHRLRPCADGDDGVMGFG